MMDAPTQEMHGASSSEDEEYMDVSEDEEYSPKVVGFVPWGSDPDSP